MSKRSKTPKPSGLRKYWPHLTLKECELEREKMALAQTSDGHVRCAICNKPEGSFKKRLAVDHNHKTSWVRGLLCYRCNKFLVGRFTLTTILPVVEYLIKHEDGK